MGFFDSFVSAVRAIAANKLRSALTMLGVVIGVGSVIAMIGIGEGTKRKSLEELEIMGSNRITVAPNWQRGRTASDGQSTLRPEDVDALRENVPMIKEITGVVRDRVTAKFGSNNMPAQVQGAEPPIQQIENARKMYAGRWYTYEDEAMLNMVCVLGYAVYEKLFGTDDAIGATVKLDNKNFTVIGVVDYKGGTGFNNPDELIYAPLRTTQYRLTGQKNRYNMITLQASSSELLPVLQADVENTLFRTRRSASGEELFRVFNQAESLEAIQKQSRLLSFLLAGIASVSLLVGGIGIMNIMLVSVTERTREIGLRKAIGARRITILSQFLFESTVLCIMGGLFGILLGLTATNSVAKLFEVPGVISMPAIALAFSFAACVGLFFGIYPAMRASNLQPIEALKYE